MLPNLYRHENLSFVLSLTSRHDSFIIQVSDVLRDGRELAQSPSELQTVETLGSQPGALLCTRLNPLGPQPLVNKSIREVTILYSLIPKRGKGVTRAQ